MIPFSDRWVDSLHSYLLVHRVDHDETEDPTVQMLACSNKSGYAFKVVATRLPGMIAAHAGNEVLVTVVEPFRTAYAFSPEGILECGYVREKLIPKDWADNAGVVAGVVQTVALLLDRDPLWPEVD